MSWGGYASYLGYASTMQPIYYDYGDSVVYQNDQVYYDNQAIASATDYADQAAQIAAAGRQVAPAADDSGQPLGVFALVQGEETSSKDIFQLAINKSGSVRGNYYNAISDSTQPLTGSLDARSQRVAWTIGDRKEHVYETGLYNLTKDETNLLAHFDMGRTEQYKLFRMQQQEQQQSDPGTDQRK